MTIILPGIKLYELDVLKAKLPQHNVAWNGKALSIVQKRKAKKQRKLAAMQQTSSN